MKLGSASGFSPSLIPSSTNATCAVCVDMGTTNTRVWLVRGAEVLARAQAGVGVRDTARDGSPARIRNGLRELIQTVREQGQKQAVQATPTCVLAAGMITSPLGLAEVPHVTAPAGKSELSSSVREFQFPDVTELPIFLVPGVRCGPRSGALETISEIDVMRGEETLCLGLIALGLIQPPATLLNVGSHWKAIRLDDQGRIHSSITTLSGELIHATQTQTILASAVPRDRPSTLDAAWCEVGMKEERGSGLARALFCVRLLELNRVGTPEQRLSFLVGAFVAADLDAMRRRGVFESGASVLITGAGAVAEAWRNALEKDSHRVVVLAEPDVEAGLLAGLRTVGGAVR